MEFSIASLLDAFLFLSVFLLVGYAIREAVKVLGNIYLPASVVGGIIALILGPQVLGLIEVPAALGALVDPLTCIVFTCLSWGFTITLGKLRAYADFLCVNLTLMVAQIGIGCGVGVLLWKIWPMLPKGWSYIMPVAFMGGHSTVPIYGNILASYGSEGVTDFGMVFATIGLVVGIVVGTVMCNIGIRKGWAAYMRNASTDAVKSARFALPEKLRQPIGMTRVNNVAVNNLVFQFAIVCVVYLIGRSILRLLNPYFSSLLGFTISESLGGIFGAFIVWPIVCKLKLDKYVDKPTDSTIAGALVDLIVLAACATINLTLVATYWLPILIVAVVGTAVTAAVAYGLAYRICKVDWFEKASYLFGLATGVAATGMALLREVDPENETCVYEVRGIGSAIIAPINSILLPTFAIMAVQTPGREAIVGTIVAIVVIVVSLIIFRNVVKQRGS